MGRPTMGIPAGEPWDYGGGGEMVVGGDDQGIPFPEAGRYRVRSISTVSPHLQVNQARVPAAREADWYT